MILCPFVFLWTKSTLPPLKLQPGEVASVHWVPLRTLLSPASRTFQHVDTSDRFTHHGGIFFKTLLKSFLGLMRFSAIRLSPSESLQCSSADEFFPADVSSYSQSNKLLPNLISHLNPFNKLVCAAESKPLLLWGLTLGIIIDFLNQLPPHNAIEIWSYPNFTNYDVRLIINLLTISLKNRNKILLERNIVNQKRTMFDSEAEATDTADNTPTYDEPLAFQVSTHKSTLTKESCAVGIMLEGYYARVRSGAVLAIGIRTIGMIYLAFIALKKFRK